MEITEAEKNVCFVITDFKINYLSFHVITRLQRSLLVPYLSNKLLSVYVQSLSLFSPLFGSSNKRGDQLTAQAVCSFTMLKKGTVCCQEAAIPLLYTLLYGKITWAKREVGTELARQIKYTSF